jgi:uncharacterized protein
MRKTFIVCGGYLVLMVRTEVAPYFFEKRGIRDGTPLIEGLPEVGLVGTIVSSYIASRLGGESVGYIEITDLPPILLVYNSKIMEPCRILRIDADSRQLMVLSSDVPIPPRGFWAVANSIVEIASSTKSPIVCVSGIPEPDRLSIDRPKVYYLSNDESLGEMAASTGAVEKFENGYLTGIKAAILKGAERRGVKVLLALAQSHLNYPDPGAAAEVVIFLNKLFGTNIAVEPLLEQAEQIKMHLRDLMRRTTSSMAPVPVGLELEPPPGYIR